MVSSTSNIAIVLNSVEHCALKKVLHFVSDAPVICPEPPEDLNSVRSCLSVLLSQLSRTVYRAHNRRRQCHP